MQRGAGRVGHFCQAQANCTHGPGSPCTCPPALNRTNITSDWVSVAWGSPYGGLIGSTALYMHPCANCTTGVGSDAVAMAGYGPIGFRRPPNTQILAMAAAVLGGTHLAMSFEIPRPALDTLKLHFVNGAYFDIAGDKAYGRHRVAAQHCHLNTDQTFEVLGY